MNRREFQKQLALLLCTPGLLRATSQKSKNVQELLKQTRTALGGESKIAGVRSLTAVAKFRRPIGDREMTGEVQYDILIPDHYMKTETLSLPGGAEATMIDALSGTESWRDTKTGPSMGGGHIVIRRPDAADPAGAARQTQELRAELSRQSILLLGGLSSLQASYAGEAESEDGKADTIDFKSENFEARLFLDIQSHIPLMMTYKTAAPRIVMQTMRAAPGSAPSTERHAEESAERMRQEAERAPLVDAEVTLDDYRSVSGIQFPHRLTRSINGKVAEELEFVSFKVNPNLKPENFQRK